MKIINIVLMLCFFCTSCATYRTGIISSNLGAEQRKTTDPYINKMCKRIEDHWKPSEKIQHNFTKNGEVVIQFKIMPDGHVKDVKVIAVKGEKSLREDMKNQALKAVLDSSPFNPIPSKALENEEEKYFNITHTFYYKPGDTN